MTRCPSQPKGAPAGGRVDPIQRPSPPLSLLKGDTFPSLRTRDSSLASTQPSSLTDREERQSSASSPLSQWWEQTPKTKSFKRNTQSRLPPSCILALPSLRKRPLTVTLETSSEGRAISQALYDPRIVGYVAQSTHTAFIHEF